MPASAADHARDDIKAAVATYLRRRTIDASCVLVLQRSYARALAGMVNFCGEREFPDVTEDGGELFGLPVLIDSKARTSVQLRRRFEFRRPGGSDRQRTG